MVKKGLTILGKISKILPVPLLLAVNLLFGSDVGEKLKTIPEPDREDIRLLFHTILFKDHGVYTLFGDKPISVSGDFLVTPYENVLEGMKCGGIFWKQWQTWDKYKHLFPSRKYIFLREPNVLGDSESYEVDLIFIINKDEFIKTVDNHKSLFEAVLGKKIDARFLLESIEKGKISLLRSIDNNEMLLGILLGYGKHNSSLYMKRSRDFLEFEVGDEDRFYVGDARLKPIHKKLNFFGSYGYSPLIVSSVHFVADFSHPETKYLERKYKDARGKISSIYSQGDFLEITLTQLISE